jgi:hypothetical protein
MVPMVVLKLAHSFVGGLPKRLSVEDCLFWRTWYVPALDFVVVRMAPIWSVLWPRRSGARDAYL